MKKLSLLLFILLLSAALQAAEPIIHPATNEDAPGAPVGVRPYELDWAQRTAPAHEPLVDFEDLSGWRVTGYEGAEGKACRSQEQRIFGDYCAKLSYQGASSLSWILLEPPAPIPIEESFDSVNLWVRGNNWGWINPPRAARTRLWIRVRDAKNEEYRIELGEQNFDYWSLMHANCRLFSVPKQHKEQSLSCEVPAEEIADETKDYNTEDYPTVFTGIEVRGCASTAMESIYLDALQFYKRDYPLQGFSPNPKTLPWPTTEDTILPTYEIKIEHGEADEGYAWSGPLSEQNVRYSYRPKTGTLSDLYVESNGHTFQPCYKGGPIFKVNGQELKISDSETPPLVQSKRKVDGGIKYFWIIGAGHKRLEWTYTFRVKGKSMVVDIEVHQGEATEFRIGLAKGLRETKTIFFPYLTYGDDWPKTVCATGGDRPLFLWSALDYYNSDASELYGAPRFSEKGALGYTGGALYKAGIQNRLRERLFINISEDVHETLPNIPNPDSDTIDIAKECLWRNIGAPFQNEMLLKYKAYGIDKFIACHHEVGWREAGESFTLRDCPAPSIGEEKLAEYSQFVRDLGYRFGTYTNYVDFAPVNENWNENDVCLNSDGSWQGAWPRCYALKPLRAVEKEAYYAPRIHERYGTTAQYCDVHTAYTPWGRTDYDARTPGAGMFRTQYNAFAQILQNESIAHHGPVFSEGNYHWFYAGIADGNYATIVPYGQGWKLPQLVDFDLLKMHTKMTDVGMGMPQMYFGEKGQWREDTSVHSPWFDRFIAATIAFGHMGYLPTEWGFEGTLKAYYMLQALQQHYIGVPVREIRYFDGEELVDTSTAIATDAYKRQQIHIAYENGLEIWVNLNFEEDWGLSSSYFGDNGILPPGGFLAVKRSDDVFSYDYPHKLTNDIYAYMATINGERVDFLACEDYIYIDTHKKRQRTFAPREAMMMSYQTYYHFLTDGAVVIEPQNKGTLKITPATDCGEIILNSSLFNLSSSDASNFSASAHDITGEIIEELEVRTGSGLLTIMPAKNKDRLYYTLKAEEPDAPDEDSPNPILSGPGSQKGIMTAVIGDPEKRLWFFLEKDLLDDAKTIELAIDTLTQNGLIAESHRHIIKGDSIDLRSKYSLEFSIAVPDDVSPNSLQWYQFQFVRDGKRFGNLVIWPLLIKEPFHLDMKLESEFVFPGEALHIKLSTISNLRGHNETSGTLSVDGESTQTQKGSKLVGHKETQIWPLQLPSQPTVKEILFKEKSGIFETELTRYLRTTLSDCVLEDLTEHDFESGIRRREQDEAPCDEQGTGASVSLVHERVGAEEQAALFMHPPYKIAPGYSFAAFDLSLPSEAAQLTFNLAFRVGSSSEDGCIFKVVVVHEGQEEELFSERYDSLVESAAYAVDLSAYADKDITLKLLTDPGRSNNTTSDWALWGSPRIVTKDKVLAAELLEEAPEGYVRPAPRKS